MLQHGGNVVGWGAMLFWVPEERFVVSTLGNTLLHLSAAAYCIVDVVLALESPHPSDHSADAGRPGSYETGLVQLYLDTFVIDLDGDGVLDPLFDPTFIPRGGSGGPTRWLRNRSFVGQRQIPPRHTGARRAPNGFE